MGRYEGKQGAFDSFVKPPVHIAAMPQKVNLSYVIPQIRESC